MLLTPGNIAVKNKMIKIFVFMEFMFQYEETDNEQNLWVKKLMVIYILEKNMQGRGIRTVEVAEG